MLSCFFEFRSVVNRVWQSQVVEKINIVDDDDEHLSLNNTWPGDIRRRGRQSDNDRLLLSMFDGIFRR